MLFNVIFFFELCLDFSLLLCSFFLFLLSLLLLLFAFLPLIVSLGIYFVDLDKVIVDDHEAQEQANYQERQDQDGSGIVFIIKYHDQGDCKCGKHYGDPEKPKGTFSYSSIHFDSGIVEEGPAGE